MFWGKVIAFPAISPKVDPKNAPAITSLIQCSPKLTREINITRVKITKAVITDIFILPSILLDLNIRIPIKKVKKAVLRACPDGNE